MDILSIIIILLFCLSLVLFLKNLGGGTNVSPAN